MSQAVPPPPPSYDEAMFGRPAEPADAPLPQLTTYNTMHDYVQSSSAAPAAPSVPSTSIPPTYWTYHGLDQLTNLHQVCVSDRKHDSYRVTDTTKTLLFTAALEMESVCLCCTSERGPGMNFFLLTSTDQKVLLGNRIKNQMCCAFPVETVTVSRPPDVKIGTVEGYSKNFSLKNASGDILCNLEMRDRGCCDCSDKTYQVVPSSAPYSQGSVEIHCDGCMITFPSDMDVISKALLICFAVNLLYSREEDRKQD
ncbi:uncharacterized protein LOC125045647 isoform X1 [Penaeus chinensis]|uniref:uncharacterized protein LOC125045647 isoform X1 n=1 Tax=Penaeus chinensis TaxID=139456 RepID=UPI001FB5C8CF|nr:uncharacterized protein LOC125045647 isoform X1 [Penaeus chinensis]